MEQTNNWESLSISNTTWLQPLLIANKQYNYSVQITWKKYKRHLASKEKYKINKS
jgi:hypothetical protein